MARIIDLDELLPEPKHVRLKAKTYTLPPDLPVELYLKINRQAASDEERSDHEAIEELYADVLGLFREHQPDLQSLPLSLAQLMLVLSRVYGSEQPEEDSDEARPPQRSRSGGATKTGRAPKKTSSPRSSSSPR